MCIGVESLTRLGRGQNRWRVAHTSNIGNGYLTLILGSRGQSPLEALGFLREIPAIVVFLGQF